MASSASAFAETKAASTVGKQAYGDMVVCVVIGLAYAFYLTTFYRSMSILHQRYRTTKAKPTLWLLSSLLLLFFTTTGYFIFEMALRFYPLAWANKPVTASSPYWKDSVSSATTMRQRFICVTVFFEVIGVAAADAIIINRATALYVRSKLIVVSLWILLAVDIAYSLVPTLVRIILVGKGEYVSNYTWLVPLETTRLFLSFGVNAIATMSIFYRTWEVRRNQRSSHMRSTRAYDILMFLVECGLLFGILQFLYGLETVTITNSATAPPSWVMFARVVSAIVPIVGAMLPSTIVVIIENNYSTIQNITSAHYPSNVSLSGSSSHTKHTDQLSSPKFASRQTQQNAGESLQYYVDDKEGRRADSLSNIPYGHHGGSRTLIAPVEDKTAV